MKPYLFSGIACLLILVFFGVACSSPPASPQSMEVTRIVERTVVIPLEVLVTQIVEVTRQVVVTPTSVPPTTTPTLPPFQPQDAQHSPYVRGNASPTLPDGDPGEISVIATGPYSGSSMPVVVRNNTSEPLIRIEVSAIAKDANGNLLSTGGDQGFNPNLVMPGEIALGYIYFGSDVDLPADVFYEFEGTGVTLDSDLAKYENIRDLDVSETSLVDNRIVGLFTNAYTETVYGPIDVVAYCFSETGELLYDRSNYTDKDTVDSGDTVPFQIELGRDSVCPVYLIAGAGFSD